jgi:hypothetical protein
MGGFRLGAEIVPSDKTRRKAGVTFAGDGGMTVRS